MSMRAGNRGIAAALVLAVGMLAGCEGGGGGVPGLGGGVGIDLPPNRADFGPLGAGDLAAHAQAAHAALEERDDGVWQSWTAADGREGALIVVASYRMEDGNICRVLLDALQIDDARAEVNDVACWGEGRWRWLRPGAEQPPVLSPLASYTADRRISLRRVARANRVRVADVKALNPVLPNTVDAGTVVYLPKPG